MEKISERPVCHRAEDLVTYLYGEATAEEARDFANHMRQCDACRAEFTLFNNVHESMVAWRSEVLGPVRVREPEAAIQPVAMSPAFVHHPRKLSGLAALREFFAVSPLWLRGATAFAGLLLCVLGIVMIARMSQKPVQVAKTGDGKVYTQQEVQAEVNRAVEKKVRELTANNQNPSTTVGPVNDKPKKDTSRGQVASNRQPNHVRPQRLTRQEREQLAADLRLTSPAEEEEMLLTFPEQENPNQ